MSSGWHPTKTKGSKRSTKRRSSSSRSSNSKVSTEDSSSSSYGEKRKRRYRNNSRDELKKARPPTFNGETKNDQEAEAWILGMRKYFQVHDYSGNMKDRVTIFNLTGRASIWWEHFRQVKRLIEGILCGNSSRSISSRSTSLTGTATIKSKSSMSWDWDRRPWKRVQISSYKF